LNDEECEEMKQVDLGEKCIDLPDQGLTHPKALSNRVCYGGDYDEFGFKVDGDGCDSCKDEFHPPTKSPTASLVEETVTEPPVPASTTDEPTAAPVKTEDPTTDYPTYDSDDSDDDTDEPTAAPVKTNEPTAAPVQTDEPTSAPVESPTEEKTSCECDVNDEEALTFKCGKDMYICPSVDHICSVSPAQGSKFYDITQEQCDEMKTVGLGEKCVPLPQYGITDSGKNGAKGLSHRDCYSDFAPNGMKEDGSCDICKNSFPYSPGAFSTDNFALP
jgi:hypothetical protein